MKIVIFAILVLLAVAKVKDDLITEDLPGCGHWDFDAYSGYVSVDDHNEFHYLFVESQNQPETDPLLIWFTGGPGCSSMLGFFMENGACVWDGLDDSPLPHNNEFSWNAKANVLYVENPAGVGFNLGYKGEHLDDEVAGKQEMNFVLNWFQNFPEFKKNDLYVTGESYGGIYVPYLAYNLHANNHTTRSGGDINLKGVAIGNGVTDWSVDCDVAYVEMAYAHGLIPLELQERILKAGCDFSSFGEESRRECQEIYNEFSSYTRNINIYDVYRAPQDGGLMSPKPSVARLLSEETFASYTPFLKTKRLQDPFGLQVPQYLDREDVREILHVTKKSGKFQPCVNFDYSPLEKASLWIYPILKEGGYRILKYSGDTDGAVPTLGTERWLDKLGWPVKINHRPFVINDKVAGYYTEREGNILDSRPILFYCFLFNREPLSNLMLYRP